MLHEEIIRMELSCLDRKKLVKNEMSGSFERDDAVFQMAARWLGYYGESWLKPKGKFSCHSPIPYCMFPIPYCMYPMTYCMFPIPYYMYIGNKANSASSWAWTCQVAYPWPSNDPVTFCKWPLCYLSDTQSQVAERLVLPAIVNDLKSCLDTLWQEVITTLSTKHGHLLCLNRV